MLSISVYLAMAIDVAALAREPLALLLGSTLLSSLIGSIHCAGMCGPLCLIASTSSGPEKPAQLTIAGRSVADRSAAAGGSTRPEPAAVGQVPAFAYHLGRLAIYTSLGALAGSLGAVVDFGSGLLGLQRIAALAAATVVIAMALVMILRLSGVGFPSFAQSAASLPSRVLSARLLSKTRRLPALYRAAMLGLLSGLLPCGWLYAFVLVAAGTASAGTGVLVMLAFWLGTVPLLVAMTVAARRLTGIGGPWLKLATACLLLVAGLGTIAHRSSGLFGQDATAQSALPVCCEPTTTATKSGVDDLCTAQPAVGGKLASQATSAGAPAAAEAVK
jgi:sulfite exporter TauE/SafE